MSEIAIREELQELDAREADGISVQLLYQKVGNTVLIHLVDSKEEFEDTFIVPPDQAHDAFYHPYAYYSDTRVRQDAA
jgi:hypothetical protein